MVAATTDNARWLQRFRGGYSGGPGTMPSGSSRR